MLDNASDDGSAAEVERWNAGPRGLGERLRLIALEQRAGKAENDSRLLREARGEFCLLLNEDSELRPGAAAALVGALRRRPARGGRGREPARSRGRAAALRLAAARARDLARRGAVPAPRARHPEPRRSHPRGRLGPVGGDARAPRGRRPRSATSTPTFFVYSDETDFCEAPARRRRAGPLGPGGRGGPPRAARHRPRRASAASSSSTAAATSTCASTTPPSPAFARPAAGRLELRAAGARGGRAPRPRPAPGTCCTPARRCSPAAARACARRPRLTTGPSTPRRPEWRRGRLVAGVVRPARRAAAPRRSLRIQGRRRGPSACRASG